MTPTLKDLIENLAQLQKSGTPESRLDVKIARMTEQEVRQTLREAITTLNALTSALSVINKVDQLYLIDKLEEIAAETNGTT